MKTSGVIACPCCGRNVNTEFEYSLLPSGEPIVDSAHPLGDAVADVWPLLSDEVKADVVKKIYDGMATINELQERLREIDE